MCVRRRIARQGASKIWIRIRVDNRVWVRQVVDMRHLIWDLDMSKIWSDLATFDCSYDANDWMGILHAKIAQLKHSKFP